MPQEDNNLTVLRDQQMFCVMSSTASDHVRFGCLISLTRKLDVPLIGTPSLRVGFSQGEDGVRSHRCTKFVGFGTYTEDWSESKTLDMVSFTKTIGQETALGAQTKLYLSEYPRPLFLERHVTTRDSEGKPTKLRLIMATEVMDKHVSTDRNGLLRGMEVPLNLLDQVYDSSFSVASVEVPLAPTNVLNAVNISWDRLSVGIMIGESAVINL